MFKEKLPAYYYINLKTVTGVDGKTTSTMYYNAGKYQYLVYRETVPLVISLKMLKTENVIQVQVSVMSDMFTIPKKTTTGVILLTIQFQRLKSNKIVLLVLFSCAQL